MPTTVIPYTTKDGHQWCKVLTTTEAGEPWMELDCPIEDCPVPCASSGDVPADCPVLAGEPCPLGVSPEEAP